MISINWVLSVLLFLYNVIFMSYNEHFRSSSAAPLLRFLSIIILSLLLVVILYNYTRRNDGLKLKIDYLLRVVWNLLLAGILALLISVCRETINRRFDLLGHSIKYFSFFVIPIVFSYFWVKSVDEKNKIRMIDSIFYAGVVYFFIYNISNLNLTSIMNISWNNSYSSVFESDNAHLFLFTLMFYQFIDDKPKATVSLVLCMLSLKRISFILAPILYFCYKPIFKMKIHSIIPNFLPFALILIPFGIEMVSTQAFQDFFLNITGMNLNLLSSGRIASITVLEGEKAQFLGMGSIAYFIENSQLWYIRRIGYLHCDLLVWLWECSILPIVFLAWGLRGMAKTNVRAFILTAYLSLMLSTTHFLDMHLYMTTFYMITFYFMEKESTAQKISLDSQKLIKNRYLPTAKN